jgi:hypothetical protein
MASEDIGSVYKTQVPGYDDPADIQAALKLYHYGTVDAPLTENDIVADSVAGHLKSIDSRVDILEVKRTGGDVTTSKPTNVPDGYIWVDKNTPGNGAPIYSSAVVSVTTPTQGLTDGLIWVNPNSGKTLVYLSSSSSWIPVSPLPTLVDAAGDLIYGTDNNEIARLAIGSEGQILKVVSGLPAWGAQTGSWSKVVDASLSNSSVNITSLSGSKIYLILREWSHNYTSGNASIAINFNNDTASHYFAPDGHTTSTFLATPLHANTGTYTYGVMIDLADTSIPLKPVSCQASTTDFGYYYNTSAISSIQLTLSNGTFDAGTVEVWRYA